MLKKEYIVFWNCRSTGTGQFLRELMAIQTEHKPILIILLEPKINGEVADRICMKIGKSRWGRSEAEGSVAVYGCCGARRC